MDADIKEKLIKIQRLAQEGSNGERRNAAAMLGRLMKKYGLTYDDLAQHKVSWHKFSYGTKAERRLLTQVAMHIANIHSASKPRPRSICFKVTDDQAAKIAKEFATMRTLFKGELETLYVAFIHKHELFPPNMPESDGTLDCEELTRLLNMIRAMRDAPQPTLKALPVV